MGILPAAPLDYRYRSVGGQRRCSFMEWNIESILSDLGIDYQFYRNTNNKKTFRNVKTIRQGGEEDLCYCSFDGEEAISLISQSSAGIILCKRSLEEFIDQYYLMVLHMRENIELWNLKDSPISEESQW